LLRALAARFSTTASFSALLRGVMTSRLRMSQR